MYIDKYGASTNPEQLKQHSCIIANSDQWLFEQNGKPLNAVRVNGRWRSNNSSAVLKACEEGLSVVYLPRSSFNGGLTNGKLVPVLEEYWGSGTSSWIVYQNRRFLPQRARLAIDFLVSYFSDWDE